MTVQKQQLESQLVEDFPTFDETEIPCTTCSHCADDHIGDYPFPCSVENCDCEGYEFW